MLSPLSSFCCGCSVPAGAAVILVGHLALCLAYTGSACSNIILGIYTYTSNLDAGVQLMAVVFALIGIPTIVSGLFGLYYGLESNVQIYLYYMTLTFLLNLAGLVGLILSQDPCDTFTPLIQRLSTDTSEAFMCGAARIAMYLAMALNMVVAVFCLWVVWSASEVLEEVTVGPELHDLLTGNESLTLKAPRQDGPYAGIVGFAHTKLPGPYPSVYGSLESLESLTLEAPPSIFGGKAGYALEPESSAY